MHIAENGCRPQTKTEGEHLAIAATSVEQHASRTPTLLRLARSLARHEHETKPKPISGWDQLKLISPQPPIYQSNHFDSRRFGIRLWRNDYTHGAT